MSQINWGIVGLGSIAHQFSTALKIVDDACIYGMASLSKNKRELFTKEFSPEKMYSTYEELILDEAIDVVYVAVPHNFHFEIVHQAISHGKSVLCEKPICVNASQLRELMTLAKIKDVFLMEGMWTRFLPGIESIMGRIQNGDIGEVQCMKANFGFASVFDEKSRFYDPNLAGGALLDVGIYPISLSYMVHNTLPKKMISHAYLGKTGIDEISSYVFEYEKSKSFLSSSINMDLDCSASIIGETHSIHFPQFWRMQGYTIVDRDGNSEEFEFPHECNGFEYEIRHTHECLKEGLKESPKWSLATSLNIAEQMDSMREFWGMKYPFEK